MRVWAGLCAVLLLCGTPALAQEPSWGVKGGVNLGTLAGASDPAPDFGFRIGFAAGGFFTWPIGARLDVQPEGLFSQQGAKLDAAGVDSVTIALDSIAVPVLVRYKLRPSGKGLVVFAGPSIGFNIIAKAKAKSGGETITDDFGDQVETVDYAVVFGAGWESGRLTIDGRYSWGLSRIAKDEGDESKHRVITVLAGVRF